MTSPPVKFHFRNDLLHWWAIFLLPIIAVLQCILGHETSPYLMCYTFVSTIPTLLAYRFNSSFATYALSSTVFHLIVANSFQLYPSSVAILVIINSSLLCLLPLIPSVYTRCFTFVEFTIVIQSIVYYFLKILQFYFSPELLRHNANFQTETSIVCLTCYSFLLFALFLSKLPTVFHLKSLCYLIVLPIALYCSIWHALSKEPISWIQNLVLLSPTRVKLFISWFSILAITLIFAFVHTFFSQSSTTTVTRKLFHLSISLVYLLGIHYDPSFLKFSSELILFVFCYIEILRLNDVYLVADIITRICSRFRDEKDSGILTLTHIYLLIGCSAPLWLCPSSLINAPESKLLLASGIVTVGIGDTFAAIGGYNFGKHKWPGSSKSYEGTACSFVSQLIALVYLHSAYSNATIPLITIVQFVFISLATSFVETFTPHVDNLILPLFQYAFFLILL